MPRSDRRFTGKDIARFYCNNLSYDQKALAVSLLENCQAVSSDKELLIILLQACRDTVDLVSFPFSGVMSKLLGYLIDAVGQEYSEGEIIEYLSIDVLE